MININFTEEELLLGAIYSRLEYLHAMINGAMTLSPLKCLFLDEASALIAYSETKKINLPPHILVEHEEDMEQHINK